MDGCIFCKIAKGEIPAKFFYQDDQIAVFQAVPASGPIHMLFIPKAHIGDFIEADNKVILAIKAKIIDKVKELGLIDKGYRIVINGGTAKAVPHFHVHLLGDVEEFRDILGTR